MKNPENGFAALFDIIGLLARRRHQLGDQAFAALGLNHTEARLLSILAERGGEATQEALGSVLHIDRTNTGRALKALEAQGYLRRTKSEADARTNTVQITDAGRTAAERIFALRREMAQSFFGDLTEVEASRAVELLQRAVSRQSTETAAEVLSK